MSELRLRNDRLAWREIEGEVIAVDVQRSAYLSANEAGAFLWQMLASGATRDGLVSALVERFGIERERAEADVDAFVQSLESRGLLE